MKSIYQNHVFSHLIIKVHDDGGVEKGWDGVEHANIDAVCDQQHNVAWVQTQVLDGCKIGLLVVLFEFLKIQLSISFSCRDLFNI